MTESSLKNLIKNNAEWAARIKRDDPDFFRKLCVQQSPEYLWIGCSDSRVPANQIVGLLPGEVFVHRNVANLVVHSDLNCLSVIQFAIDILKIKHVIVCGHYGCSGIHAAINDHKIGLADNWLRIVQEAYKRRAGAFDGILAEHRWDALCEMNVIDQVRSVTLTTVMQEAWAREQNVRVHGVIYGIHDGLIRELLMDISSNAVLEEKYEAAMANTLSRYSGEKLKSIS